MKIEAKTVEEYFSNVGEREPQLRELDALIRKTAPNLGEPILTEGMASTMIGYGMMPYQSKSMKTPGEWPLVILAAQKNYISLYLCALDNGVYIAEKYQKELGKVSVGKSCIRFKKLEDLNLETTKKLLKDLNKRFLTDEKLFA